ncbi:hypothetical protein NQ314_015963 [Rhamnusium bicolor]|uniref:Uncharacterized protein n=1 Tax=Rhamnusium bicolor TaxID=1586634 RepID=A0AAV8WY54_9CUCU|nr:hypothetical protein NQ314_015963 [Rhamnusium bicolor]
MSDESDNYCDISDGEIDKRKHEKLVDDILNLNKIQNVKKPSRTEPALQISEFNLVKSVTGNKGSVHLNELTKALKGRKKHEEISNKLKSTSNKSKTLPTPLEKPQADRIRRSVNYEKSRLQLDRWEALVTSNRAASHLTFPLDSVEKLKIEEKESEVYPTTWRLKSKLQTELEKLKPRVEEYLIDTEDKEKFPLTLEELKEQRERSSKAASTSKKRGLRKDLSRQVLAQQLAISRDLTQKLKSVNSDSEDEDTESEQNLKSSKVDENNPWVAGMKPNKEVVDFVSGYRKYWNEQNNQPEKNKEGDRVNDRKHENLENSEKVEVKKAVNKITTPPNKNKKSSRLKRSRSNKIKKKAKSEGKPNINSFTSTSDWEVSSLQEKDNDIEGIFYQLEEKLKQKLKQKYNKVKGDRTNINKKKSTKIASTNKSKKKIDLTIPSKSKKHVIDEEMIEQLKSTSEDAEIFDKSSNSDLNHLKNILNTVEENKPTSDIDPNKFVQVKKINLSTAIPDILMTDENEENDQTKVILEAFEDDDIVQDFEKEKAEEIEKDTPKDIDLNLPGWGSWGGSNINPSKRKRKRFIIKMPPKMPRRDDNKGSLIINEKAQSKIKPHMVSELPFPFKTVKDYEASIRAPIGNTFVPETAFKKLIEPAVTTKMGAIIEPISKSLLIGKRKYEL